ncbi:hypothetical protein M9H77_26054 [Catharanthus roseus]|uniref:Uncharacterized protein n=1 Tax=Catharanthus roseus TaxID=4058 RepID=A0ACC0A9K9_CATRO|nr:hypothetical protein M9H77_26054 [Catharanthus roseus]
MARIVLTLVMDSSNNRSISNGHNNSFNIMASVSSNTESGMASNLIQLGPMTSLLQHIEEEAYLLSPKQRVSTTPTEFPPFTVAPQGPPPDSRNIVRDNSRFSIRDYVASQKPTKLEGLHRRAPELRIAAYVFGLSVLTVRSNASEQWDDGSSSTNVVNQSLTGLNHQPVSGPAILVSTGNVNQGHGGSSNSSLSDINMIAPRLIGQNSNQLPSVHVLTSIDTSDERTIEPSSTLAGPNRACIILFLSFSTSIKIVVNNVQNSNSEHDRMRMDIDNLSYDDLLALEENIGNASTTLNEEIIHNRLKQSKYRVNKYVGIRKMLNCKAWELDRRYNYHMACIKKWLMEKIVVRYAR